jgi:sugar phosphate isomerase/epimerase
MLSISRTAQQRQPQPPSAPFDRRIIGDVPHGFLDQESAMSTPSRREFLSMAAGGATAAMFGTLPMAGNAAEDDESHEMSFGLVTYLWGRDWDLPTLIANCEATGVLGVELRVEHAHGVEPSLSAKERQEAKARFADSPVVCLGPGTNQKFDDPDPAKLKENIEGAKAYVKLSHDIGGSGVKVKPDRLHKEVAREKTLEQIGRSLDDLGKFASEWGQEIRLEVHGQCAPLPMIAQIFSYVEQPNVGVCWNCNEQDLEGEGLEHNFRLVRDRFGRTVHVRELDDAGYPYQQLINRLVGTNYDGWVLLEARTDPDDRVAALKAQRELFENMVANAS